MECISVHIVVGTLHRHNEDEDVNVNVKATNFKRHSLHQQLQRLYTKSVKLKSNNDDDGDDDDERFLLLQQL